MKIIKKIGNITIRECETMKDIAESFGCVGVSLPGRMVRSPAALVQSQQDQEQTQEEDLNGQNN
jgi:hypothetical protein